MAVIVAVDKSRRLVHLIFSGEVNDDDLLQPIAMIPQHPDFNPEFSELVDFSKITKSAISQHVLRRLSARESFYNPASKHAVVAPRDYIFGMARMFQMISEDTRPNLAVVRTLVEAYEFLDLDPPPETSPG